MADAADIQDQIDELRAELEDLASTFDAAAFGAEGKEGHEGGQGSEGSEGKEGEAGGEVNANGEVVNPNDYEVNENGEVTPPPSEGAIEKKGGITKKNLKAEAEKEGIGGASGKIYKVVVVATKTIAIPANTFFVKKWEGKLVKNVTLDNTGLWKIWKLFELVKGEWVEINEIAATVLHETIGSVLEREEGFPGGNSTQLLYQPSFKGFKFIWNSNELHNFNEFKELDILIQQVL